LNQVLSGKQDLLTALVSQLNDYLVLLCDLEGKVTSWHPPIQEQLGYAAGDIIGKSIKQILSPNGGPLSFESPDIAVFAPQTPDVNWVVAKNGQKILMSGVTLNLQDASGNATGFARILRSVVSYKSSEINSRALVGALDHSNVLIRRWDGVIEHWTEGCERLYGFDSLEATGQILHDLLQTEYPVPLAQVHDELIQTGIWRGELKQRRKNGDPIFVSVQLVKLEPSPGQLPLIVSTHSDITSRLQMQHELESANSRLKLMAEELERSNEELEEFARIASHDLSAPITSTRWLVEMLTSRHGSQLDADGQKALAQVAVSLERMSDLVEAVLTHAKVGKDPIASLEEADTELALEVAMENLRRDVMTTGAVIHYDRLPSLLIGQQPLTQLFQNLISNAIKYRRADAAPQIHIRAEQTGALWRVCVQDNGMGVEPEWFERIFLPMQRRHSSKIAGSGIGLATCRKIVNRAGGRIWVESEVGRGSSFFFTLPGMQEVRNVVFEKSP
jgi:PAS domain S-box-containing protein